MYVHLFALGLHERLDRRERKRSQAIPAPFKGAHGFHNVDPNSHGIAITRPLVYVTLTRALFSVGIHANNDSFNFEEVFHARSGTLAVTHKLRPQFAKLAMIYVKGAHFGMGILLPFVERQGFIFKNTLQLRLRLRSGLRRVMHANLTKLLR